MRSQLILLVWMGMAVSLMHCGCNSIRTTPLDRNENGTLACGNHSGCLKGVPVMLRVPTHIEVRIYQRDYWYQDQNDKLVPVGSTTPTRFVKTEVVETEQMFLVDPKRPAAGTGVFAFMFNSSAKDQDAGKGYLKAVSYSADDETLSKSASLITSVAGLLAKRSSQLEKTSSGRSLKSGASVPVLSTDRLLQMRRFDINEPAVDASIESFLNQNLNDCHTCL